VLTGDVASMHLGLSTAEYRELSEECTDIVHAAEWGHVRSGQAHARAGQRGRNPGDHRAGAGLPQVAPADALLDVFVSGDRVGVVAEDELSAGQSFRNFYEQTKFERRS